MSEDREPPASTAEDAAAWCILVHERALSPAEQAAFDRWLADPENMRAFGDTLAAWSLTTAAAAAPEVVALRERIAARYLLTASRSGWQRGRPGRRWLPAAAACVCLAVAASVLAPGGPAAPPPSTSHAAYASAAGETRVVRTADGSVLTLAGGARLRVDFDGAARRVTLLAGAARFDVAKDPQRPFSVRAGDRLVVATGTVFRVTLTGADVRIALDEGRIVVREVVAQPDAASRRPRPATVLDPGQELIVGGGAPGTSRFGFDEEPLPRAVAAFNRTALRPILLGEPGLHRLRVSGEFRSADPEAFLESLAVLHGVTVERRADAVVLR